MQSTFEFLKELSDFAKAHGVKLVSTTINDRKNSCGKYHFIEVSFTNFYLLRDKKVEDSFDEIEIDTDSDSNRSKKVR